MARDIDQVINYIREITYIPPVMKQVIINRLDVPPTKAELEQAAKEVYPNVKNNDPWRATSGH